MAFLKSPFPLIGTIGDYTFYTMKGSDKIIARRKGGPSRKQLKTSANFAKARLHNKEFGARVKASKLVLRALWPLRNIANYNVATALHRPLKAIQDLDVTNTLGERWVCFSEYPSMLEGLSLNTANSLESMIGTITQCRIGATGEAMIQVPRLIPSISLKVDPRYSYFRLSAVLAALPDLHMMKGGYNSPVPDLPLTTFVDETTAWLPVAGVNAAHTFHLVPEFVPSANHFVWMLSLGLELGYPTVAQGIQPVPDQGAAKILRVVKGGESL